MGLAVGDAVGTTVEFRERGSFPPVTDLTGGGPFQLPVGAWTDDTSMALCLGHSLLAAGGTDHRDQMERYRRWMQDGYMSSTGDCFDIGGTVSAAIQSYLTYGEPVAGSTHPRSAGNGCIMRLAPTVLFGWPDVSRAIRIAAESSVTTHGAAECVDGCRVLAGVLCRALAGHDKEDVLLGGAASFQGEPALMQLAQGAWRTKERDAIRGSGYVVEALEAALWSFDRSDSYEEAILKVVNLGGDTDTTAAICGQIAGAFHGVDGIPESWRQKLVMGEQIQQLADDLLDATPEG